MLLAHLLKWEHQPEKRSGSWTATIVTHRQELLGDVGQGVLRAHAIAVLADAYAAARVRAAAETGLPLSEFPAGCPWSFDALIDPDAEPRPS